MTSAVVTVNFEHIWPFSSDSGQTSFIEHVLTCRNYEKSRFLLQFFSCECLPAKNWVFITSSY